MATKDPWEWLSLVDVDGPFLSRAALKSVFPNGLDRPYNAIDDVNSTFVYEHTLWSKAWTARQGKSDPADDLAWRDRWVTTVLRDLLQWDEHLDAHPDPMIIASSPDGDVSVRPWALLDAGDGPAALVVVVDPTDDLRRTGADGWAADAIDRTAALLREGQISIGLVTDGRWWGIVSAVRDVTTASGVFDSLIWREERDSRDAFLALAGLVSLAGGATEKRLPKLFELSVASAEAITEALGDQVRRAVELVLQAMSESHLRAVANREGSPLPDDSKQVYEAAVSVLMRVVFLLFAEERALLPQHQMYRDSYAISGVRVDLEHRAQNDSEEALDHTWETWHRLLAASAAIFSGATFEDTRMPAYGGSLFDPARFPWLRTTNAQGQLSVRVSDRVMLQVLKAVQIAHVGGEARQLSFRDLDVEQIGYVYEGLLGYSAEYTQDVVVGLHGKSGYEPEIALNELCKIADAATSGADFANKLIAYLKEKQPNSKPATLRQIAKAYDVDDATKAADARTRLGFVLLGRTEFVDQLAPLHALIRNDLREFPYVVPEGGLVMTESPQRANTGTHYTPRSLAEEVVLHALEPIVFSPGPLDTENRDDWVLRSSTEILNLKVADIAVGSGAFLVAAARYLADRLIEALSKEGLSEAANEDAKRWATREVVARCLYGADINGMAVEMCKLSLWLVSMDPGKPFSFVDDRVFHGNSLLGVTTERQLRAQHIDPSHSRVLQRKLLQLDVDSDLARASQLRRELSSGQVDDADRMRSTRAKRKLLDESRKLTTRLRDVADGIIAAGLRAGGKPAKAFEASYGELADALFAAFPQGGGEGDRRGLDAILSAGLTPTVDTGEARWKPLHWVIEAPDVVVDNGGFDAIIGNPPFLGGKKISSSSGVNYRDWLVRILASGATGSADLVAYFLLRAHELLNSDDGQMGLIATNTVAQGDTREVGIDRLLVHGLVLRRSIQSSPWPAKSANLEYAAIWGTNRPLSEAVLPVADGLKVDAISSLLEPRSRTSGAPVAIQANRHLAFVGSYVLGSGFVLKAEEAESLLEVSPLNAQVIHPYMNGEDLNSRPSADASRWVVNFFDWPIERAQAFGPVFDHVERTVRPERQRTKPDGEYALRKPLPDRWWQYADKRPGLYKAIKELDYVAAIALVSKTVMPMRVNARQVFSHALGVFATDDFADFAFLSSMPHQTWAITYGSTLETRVRYTPSDVFETLPRPQPTDRMRHLGEALDSERREVMLRRELGLTALYNLVNDPKVTIDPDVARIREIHIQIDVAVMEAYGWTDIPLDHGFHTYRQMERFTVSPKARVEILDRLLEENHRRVSLEAQNNGRVLTNPDLDLDPETAPEGAMF
ncbi:Eco57I restriction-modification methylase domain-containing protein [Arthrobacter silvisoli]|uniref:Eco57I restriction-modification methylase domain-containing protein n=1 Tax=Arthrobacter silvisoli TaxID=2291022 RepID=UPI001B346300|nr:DNA methyltransferase [Arthrobacter silvisoli]